MNRIFQKQLDELEMSYLIKVRLEGTSVQATSFFVPHSMEARPGPVKAVTQTVRSSIDLELRSDVL